MLSKILSTHTKLCTQNSALYIGLYGSNYQTQRKVLHLPAQSFGNIGMQQKVKQSMEYPWSL